MSLSGDDGDFVVAVDIGGTKVLVCLVDRRDEIVGERQFSTESRRGPEAIVQDIVNVSTDMLKEMGVPLSQVCGLGIASAGPSNPATGVVFNSPNLSGWHNVPLAQWIEERLGIPACLGNDATLAALGEHRYGAGAGVGNMIYVTVSTGIGGGIITEGRLYTGGLGAAGEIGHTILEVDGPMCSCGKRGCLESFSAGWALAQTAQDRIARGQPSLALELAEGNLENITAQTLFEAAERGDELSASILREGARYLGVAFLNLAVLFDPEMIVVGGGLSLRWDEYVGHAVEFVRRATYPRPLRELPIVPAKLGDRAGIKGAVALVRERTR